MTVVVPGHTRDRKLALLAAAVADHEQELGEITIEEIRAQQRADREHARIVRGGGGQSTGEAASA